MSTLTSASTVVERIISGAAPRPARLAAARGALPLAPGELVQIQIALQDDADQEIATAARQTLTEMTDDSATELANELDTPPAVLLFLCREIGRWTRAGRTLAARQALEFEALLQLCDSNDPDTLSILALNQVALTSDRRLGEKLSLNPALPEGARGRLLDLIEEIGKADRLREMLASTATEARLDGALALQPARNPFLAALGIDAEVEALLPQLDIDIGELAEKSELIGGMEEDDDASAFTKLSRMNVGQKLRVALFGTGAERAILVRDSNRLVAATVVKNPKFTEQEAETVSKSRNVSDVVMRLVARHQDFGSNYTIQLNMVRNPRCPIDLALIFLPRLNDRDVTLLLKNRNVSDAVRRQAKKLFQAREDRRRVRNPGKKH